MDFAGQGFEDRRAFLLGIFFTLVSEDDVLGEFDVELIDYMKFKTILPLCAGDL